MDYLKLIRISHYIKNGLIFLPIFFSGNLTNINMIWINILCFFCFSFISSSIYIINDIKDIEKDKLHSVKKNRPIASGKISIRNALILSFSLFIISFGIGLFISVLQNSLFPVFIILTYFISNIFYSVLGFKNISLVDVCILTLGFYLRVLLGAVVCNVAISPWLYLIVVFGAFYLGFGKRRNELKNEKGTREVFSSYSLDFLDKSMYGCMILSIVFFAFWCMEKNTLKKESIFNYLVLVPLLMIICFRYNMNVDSKFSDGDPVSVILKDKILIALSIIFTVTIGIFIYAEQFI